MPIRRVILAFTAATCLPGLALAADGVLRVVATNVADDRGSVIVWVYDNKDAWLSDEGWRTRKVVRVAGARQDGTVAVEIALPPGEYGFTVFHDVNDDGKVERNFIGLPKEPAGLSNNLRPKFGPPRWAKAKFALAAAGTEQRIALR
jgi:uncharacterized protein (DUF2141 family)